MRDGWDALGCQPGCDGVQDVGIALGSLVESGCVDEPEALAFDEERQ